MLDVHVAIGHCTKVEAYPGISRNGGTLWRVWGHDADGDEIAVGVETCEGTDGQQRVVLCTVMKG